MIAPTHTQQSSQEWILALLLGPTRPTTHNHTDFTMDDLPIEDLHKQSTQIARNVPKACNNLHDEKDKAQYARRSNDSGWTPLQQSQTGAFLTSSNAMATSDPNR